jgi:Flp pilus assembly protein TadD
VNRSGRTGRTLLFLALAASFAGCGAAPSAGGSENPEATGEPAQNPNPPPLRRMNGEKIPLAPRPQPRDGCTLDAPLPDGVPAQAGAEDLHAAGQERIRAGNGPEAVAILLKARERAPEDASISCDLATAFIQCQFIDEAVEAAERAAELAPEEVDIVANLARVYQMAGRIPDAVETLRRAERIDPEDPGVHSDLAVLLTARGELEGAETAARAATNLDPQNASHLINLGYILFRQERLVDAQLVLEQAAKLAPSSASVFNQLGLVLAAQRQDNKAREMFQKALELDPDHKAARENLDTLDDGFDFIGPWSKKRN